MVTFTYGDPEVGTFCNCGRRWWAITALSPEAQRLMLSGEAYSKVLNLDAGYRHWTETHGWRGLLRRIGLRRARLPDLASERHYYDRRTQCQTK